MFAGCRRGLQEKAVEKKPSCLVYAGEACKDDREIVLNAVGKTRPCLWHAGAGIFIQSLNINDNDRNCQGRLTFTIERWP